MEFPSLTPLGTRPKLGDVESWIDTANTLFYAYQRVLSLPSTSFWNTVTSNKSFFASFDDALQAVPCPVNEVAYSIVFLYRQDWASTAKQLKDALLAVFLRTHVLCGKIDSKLTKDEWLKMIAEKEIRSFSLTRFHAILGLFPELMSGVVKIHNSIWEGSSHIKEHEGFIKSRMDEMQQLQLIAGQLLQTFHNSSGTKRISAARFIEQALLSIAELFYISIPGIKFLKQVVPTIDIKEYIFRIISLVGAVSSSFQADVITDVALALPGYPLKNLINLLSLIEKFGADLFVVSLAILSERNKGNVLNSLLKNERLTFVLNLVTPISSMFTLNKKDEQRLNQICMSQASLVLQKVERQGLLKNIGNFSNYGVELQSAIAELQDVFPHLSAPFLHLCLRHFGGKVPEVVEALLNKDSELPRDLAALETINIKESGLSHDLVHFDNEIEDILSSVVKAEANDQRDPTPAEVKEDKKNVFKGLFSLAPVSKEEDSPSSSSQSSFAAAEDQRIVAISKLRDLFNEMKIREAREFDEPVVQTEAGPSDEKLVPMMESKKYAGISKFKTTDQDKVAVRPTYEKFKYETQDDDLYDDEYDDGYEQREFQIEPLNGYGSSDEDLKKESQSEATDPAPNTNDEGRGTQVRESQAGRGRGRGGGRRGGDRRGNDARGSQKPEGNKAPNTEQPQQQPQRADGYTGGRQRQMKERHKNAFKQRGADRKMRGAFQ